ncbi:MAG: DNA-3-methyladenine glycosylase 2 family protein [Acidobacteriota bacterium]
MRDSLAGSPKKRNPAISVITTQSVVTLAHELAARDADLARVVQQFGAPPLWARQPGFATLVHIILEQQVSLASAKAAFNRLGEAIKITPTAFLTLDDEQLKTIGFSRQKTRYCRLLAEAVLDGTLDLPRLPKLDDKQVRAALTSLTGIGDWTADIYLLMALRRADIWPKGDLALLVAAQRLKQLPSRPTHEEFLALGESWRPYRAVAARLLWHYYLSAPRK